MAIRNATNLTKKLGTNNLNGVFVALTTPFDANQDICYDKLRSNMNIYEEIPFTGYLVAGTNGEAPYLTTKERIDIVKYVRSLTEKVILGGATQESTRGACELTKEMMNVGADAVLVQPPFYYKKRMTEEVIAKHFTTIADECNAPVVIYNNPMATGLDISTNTLSKLARHPLIIGVKDTDIRKCAVTVQETKGCNFDVFIGSAGYLLGALVNGCSGGMVGLGGFLGKEICSIYNLYQEKKIEEATIIQRRICKLDSLLLAEMGVPGLKTAMDMMGLAGGLCRSPDIPTSEEDKVKIKKYLQESGFLS